MRHNRSEAPAYYPPERDNTALLVLLLAGGGAAAWYFMVGPGNRDAANERRFKRQAGELGLTEAQFRAQEEARLRDMIAAQGRQSGLGFESVLVSAGSAGCAAYAAANGFPPQVSMPICREAAKLTLALTKYTVGGVGTGLKYTGKGLLTGGKGLLTGTKAVGGAVVGTFKKIGGWLGF